MKQHHSSSPELSHAHKLVLVVDDDKAVRESLSRALETQEYNVMQATNGDEAMAVSASHPVDLLLLDLNLGPESGWSVLERFNNAYPLVPVVIITAKANQIFTALASGVGALLEKPFEVSRLFQVASELISEPVQNRLSRLAGKASGFRYLPAQTC
jgi:DNA-binding NtrC family response regulator